MCAYLRKNDMSQTSLKKAFTQEHSFMFSGTKSQTFGPQKEIASAPYFTVEELC